MKSEFQTFVKKDRSVYMGIDQDGDLFTCELPIHIMSPEASPEEIKESLQIGMNDSNDIEVLFAEADIVVCEFNIKKI